MSSSAFRGFSGFQKRSLSFASHSGPNGEGFRVGRGNSLRDEDGVLSPLCVVFLIASTRRKNFIKVDV